jgi:aldose 1-epimerase
MAERMTYMGQKYSIKSEIFRGVETFSLAETGDSLAQVAPQLGNNCFSFKVRESILEPIDLEEFIKRPTSFGIPLLFPFPNRIRDGAFEFRGTNYKVDPPRHGFVRDKSWKVSSSGASEQEGAWITSTIDATDYPDQILAQFPFPFHLEVTYRLFDSALTMEITFENTGNNDMPTGFGIHPYFRKPQQGTIQVPAQKRWELVDSLPNGSIVDVEGNYDLREPKSLDGLELDDIFTGVVSTAEDIVQCKLNDDELQTQTIVEFDAAQFPNIVVYTPPAPRRAICIEPNTCPTDGFNLQSRGIDSNIIILRPGEKKVFKISIYTRNQASALS